MTKQQIIDYVLETPHNTNPAILGQMIDEIENGDSSWMMLTEESVTTVSAPPVGAIIGALSYEGSITANTIKVTFDGNEYTLDATVSEAPGGLSYQYGGEGYTFTLDSYDGDDGVAPIGGRNRLLTENAGTYTIKIEVPQSGSSSDLSTATVTVVNNTDSDVSTYGPVANIGNFGEMNISPQVTFSRGKSFIILVMHKQHTYISLNTSATITVEGSAEIDGPDVIITGDCTITIGQEESASA